MKSFEDFKNALGARESGNRYNIVNRYGYTGRYQFGRARLSELGYKGSMENFKNDPALQEEYFLKHVNNHAANLSKYIAQAKTRLAGLTLSGLIAYAHLLGAGAARKWATSGIDGKDGNNVRGSTYAAQFSGFEIPGYDENDVKKN